MTYTLPKKQYNSSIRKVETANITIGGQNSLSFMNSETEFQSKQIIATEILINTTKNYPEILEKTWGECIKTPVDWIEKAFSLNTDLVAIRFNIQEISEIDEVVAKFEEIQRKFDKQFLIIGSNKAEIDKILLPKLAAIAKEQSIIGLVEEDSYKEIIPSIIAKNHTVIARTPIDISLAKELNILLSEAGVDANNILIDPNMGALGYGIDYAYSVIERIKTAALDGDNMLNMPIITFTGEEAWKSKETKSSDYTPDWGDLETRAILWESITTSTMLAAGADVVVMQHPKAIEQIKNYIEKGGK